MSYVTVMYFLNRYVAVLGYIPVFLNVYMKFSSEVCFAHSPSHPDISQ